MRAERVDLARGRSRVPALAAGRPEVQIAALTDGVRQLDGDCSDCRQTVLVKISSYGDDPAACHSVDRELLNGDGAPGRAGACVGQVRAEPAVVDEQAL